MTDWCYAGQHERCPREYERFYTGPNGKIVWTGEMRKCECSKRGCKCYVPKKDQTKKRRRRK